MRSTVTLSTMLVLSFGSAAQGADFRVIHDFCTASQDCSDGGYPLGSLTVDAKGNVYGTALVGGPKDAGTVYELKRGHGGQYALKVLYTFCREADCDDGAQPVGGVIRDVNGNLYGMTMSGRGSQDGTVFKLAPRRHGEWTQTVLQFFDGTNGSLPQAGFGYAGATSGLPYDGVSPLYATTKLGGSDATAGTVFEARPDGDGWQFETIANFGHFDEAGFNPINTPVVDAAGNVFVTTGGGVGNESVIALTHGDDGWSEAPVYRFCETCNDQTVRPEGLTLDAAGALIGAAGSAGPYCMTRHHRPWRCGGGIFKLTPDGTDWGYSALYDFCAANNQCVDGVVGMNAPAPVIDAAGNIYGATHDGGSYGGGVLFRIRTDGTYEALHQFCSSQDCPDGSHPAGLGISAEGRIYGVTSQGGARASGTAFEYIP